MEIDPRGPRTAALIDEASPESPRLLEYLAAADA